MKVPQSEEQCLIEHGFTKVHENTENIIDFIKLNNFYVVKINDYYWLSKPYKDYVVKSPELINTKITY